MTERETILTAVATNPGATIKKIADATGISYQRTRNTLIQLFMDKLVVTRIYKGSYRYTAVKQ